MAAIAEVAVSFESAKTSAEHLLAYCFLKGNMNAKSLDKAVEKALNIKYGQASTSSSSNNANSSAGAPPVTPPVTPPLAPPGSPHDLAPPRPRALWFVLLFLLARGSLKSPSHLLVRILWEAASRVPRILW